jgi:hypothetical protein
MKINLILILFVLVIATLASTMQARDIDGITRAPQPTTIATVTATPHAMKQIVGEFYFPTLQPYTPQPIGGGDPFWVMHTLTAHPTQYPITSYP